MHEKIITQRREDGQFSFKRETVGDLEIKYQENFERQEGV